jgi:hypothetical protein
MKYHQGVGFRDPRLQVCQSRLPTGSKRGTPGPSQRYKGADNRLRPAPVRGGSSENEKSGTRRRASAGARRLWFNDHSGELVQLPQHFNRTGYMAGWAQTQKLADRDEAVVSGKEVQPAAKKKKQDGGRRQ